jgi:hypothetical protein
VVLRGVRFTETGSRMVVARGWVGEGAENRESFMGWSVFDTTELKAVRTVHFL